MRSHLQPVFQAMHNLFVANAKTVQLCHELLPSAKIGCMLSLSNTRTPAPASPRMFLDTYELRRRSLLFGDVMFRGAYPGYAWRMMRRGGA